MTTVPSPADRKDSEERITIHAVFGSKIQYDVHMRVLRQMLEAWRREVESRHKKNRVRVMPEDFSAREK